MLKRVDRVQIVVHDRDQAVRTAAAVFGAEVASSDRVEPLGAQRTAVRAGASMIEFLEVDGAGPVADFVARWGGGLYAAGFAVADLNAAAALLARNRVGFARAADQISLDAGATCGMPVVLSPFEERVSVGAIKAAKACTTACGSIRPPFAVCWSG
jgi:hypothetical protein